jgi:hypothetical protein
MTENVHRLYLSLYVIVVLAAFILFGLKGIDFYLTPIQDRYFHPDYAMLKPSGLLGHGMGIAGTVIVLVGVFTYMARKRLKFFSRFGILKYWLEFHVFLCALGPVFILYHTSFKFGGIVSVSFWSLVAVVASGVIGRFIYLQIPRTIEGRELSLQEVQEMRNELVAELKVKYNIDIEEFREGNSSGIKSGLNAKHLPVHDYKKVKRLIISQRKIVKRIERLDMMQNIFKLWHVAHLPFALIMLIVMIIHVAVALTFGYRWIF